MAKELSFKNINKIFPKDIIKKMRQEDLRSLYVNKKKFMTPSEKRIYQDEIFGKGDYPVGNEVLVEKIKKKLRFTKF